MSPSLLERAQQASPTHRTGAVSRSSSGMTSLSAASALIAYHATDPLNTLPPATKLAHTPLGIRTATPPETPPRAPSARQQGGPRCRYRARPLARGGTRAGRPRAGLRRYTRRRLRASTGLGAPPRMGTSRRGGRGRREWRAGPWPRRKVGWWKPWGEAQPARAGPSMGCAKSVLGLR
jgi:hypothetical protein